MGGRGNSEVGKTATLSKDAEEAELSGGGGKKGGGGISSWEVEGRESIGKKKKMKDSHRGKDKNAKTDRGAEEEGTICVIRVSGNFPLK